MRLSQEGNSHWCELAIDYAAPAEQSHRFQVSFPPSPRPVEVQQLYKHARLFVIAHCCTATAVVESTYDLHTPDPVWLCFRVFCASTAAVEVMCERQ